MKRFLSLLALVVVPVLSWSVEPAVPSDMVGGTVENMKSYCFSGPVSARDETGFARTDVSVTWAKSPEKVRAHYRSYELYSLNTIQPIHRSEDMHDSFFGYAGIGTRSFDDLSWNLGFGARHLTACGGHMFGFAGGYQHFDVRHVELLGPGVAAEWRTPFTTLTYGYTWNQVKVKHHGSDGYLHHRREGDVTALDLSFQLPYLPWTSFTVGKTWYGNHLGHKLVSRHNFFSYRHLHFRNFNYGLRMNLLSCLAVEGGRTGGYKTDHYARVILSFGRPAANEYTLTDGVIGNEAFTARDLRNYGLAPIARARVE